MKEKTFKILNDFLTAFLLIMLVLNFYNILQRNIMENQMPKIFGYGYAVVISGSMEPEISVNDIVYVKERDTYDVGDIITYEKYDSYITHRIVDIKDGDYITKGDSNNSVDLDPVMAEQIEGKVVYVLPFFGSVVLYMKTPIGTLVTLLVSLICLEVPYRIRLSKARKKGKKKYKRIAKDMERIQTEIKKLDEEAAANPDLPVQQMVVDDPELQYQTFLEQMLQAESINDIRLPGGIVPAKPLDGEVVIGGSTEADADYVNRVAAKNAREKVEAERAVLLAQGYTFASESKESDTDELDMQSDAASDVEEQSASAKPAELAPGSAMAAMMCIASAMNTDFNLSNEDFEKGNEELLKLEAELLGVPLDDSEPESEDTISDDVTEEPPLEYEKNAEITEYAEATQIDEEELARLRRIAEIESELYGTEYVDPLEDIPSEERVPDEPVGYEAAEYVDEEELARQRRIAEIEAELAGVPYEENADAAEETPVEYSPEEIVAYAESAQEYAETTDEEEVSNEQFAVTDFVPEEPRGYVAAGGYVIDDEELARLRRIAEIESELYGTEYVDPLDAMQTASDDGEAPFTIDTTVSDQYTEIMAEEYVPDTIVGYEAAEHFDDTSDETFEEAEALEEPEAFEEPEVETFASSPISEMDIEETELAWSESGAEDIFEETAENLPQDVSLDDDEIYRQRRIAEIEAELAGTACPPCDEDEARLARIAEIEAELANASEISPKRRAMMEAREERKHKRAVDKHSRKGPPVYIPEEGVWNISVDEYSLEDVLDKDENNE